MKKLHAVIAVAAAALATAPAIAVTADSSAGAEIVAPLEIENVTALFFGTIAPSLTTADTVIVSTAGVQTCGAELTCFTDDASAAEFSVTGAVDQSYSITLPDSINISNGTETMVVNNFTGSQESGTLSTGTDNFTVGGTLNVAANQAAGEYNGTFTVTVEYQ